MSAGDLARITLATTLIALGLWVLARNRRVGEFFAGMDRDEHEHSLLNAERVQRIRESIDDPGTRALDRGKAIFAGVWLVLMGLALLGQGSE